MTELLLRRGTWNTVTPQTAGWRHLTFAVERLAGSSERATRGDEVAIVLLSGACAVETGGRRFELGPRAGVSESFPWTVYPRATPAYRIDGEAELALASAPCEQKLAPVLQRPEEVSVEVRGAGNATRQINNMIQPGFPAERLLVVEVLTPAGNWSSYRRTSTTRTALRRRSCSRRSTTTALPLRRPSPSSVSTARPAAST